MTGKSKKQTGSHSDKIHILFLSIGALAGNFRHIMDIIENIDADRFRLSATYKPACNRWTDYEISLLKQHSVSIYPLRGSALLDIQGIFDLIRIVRQESIDIIHCFDSLGIVARLIGRWYNCKTIHHLGNTPDNTVTRLTKTSISNYLSSFFLDAATFSSHGTQQHCLSHKFINWKGVRQVVTHECVDTSKIKDHDRDLTTKKYGLNPEHHILTNIGYFNEQKGQTYLIRALHGIVDANPDTTLIIVGWGPLEDHLRDLTEELNVHQSVVFTGKLNHEAVFEILSITDIFVLSSLWEGFGIVMAEAMAHRLPVVATNTEGSRELIINEKTGIIIPSKDVHRMVSAVNRLLDSPEERKAMGMSGRHRVERYFTPTRFISEHEALYKELVLR